MSDKTICTTCLRLKQGLCDGEKELTACLSYKPMTNADKIRSMTDEELAEFMIGVAQRGGIPLNGNPIRWLDWLKQEVSE